MAGMKHRASERVQRFVKYSSIRQPPTLPSRRRKRIQALVVSKLRDGPESDVLEVLDDKTHPPASGVFLIEIREDAPCVHRKIVQRPNGASSRISMRNTPDAGG